MIDKLKEYIDGAENIVFFGGAGVSTESNIPDFRSQNGLYSQQYDYPPETILSRTFFNANPKEFYRFYKNKMIFLNAKPNMAHIKLAELENKGKLKAVITQNIDGLHQAAGSKNVLELHGSVHRHYCVKCRAFHTLSSVLSKCEDNDNLPICECGGLIKPDVVLYEEPLDGKVIEKSIKTMARADLLIVGGTSLNVYPAAGLINYYNGDKIALINKSVTPYDGRASLIIRRNIGEVLGGAI